MLGNSHCHALWNSGQPAEAGSEMTTHEGLDVPEFWYKKTGPVKVEVCLNAEMDPLFSSTLHKRD